MNKMKNPKIWKTLLFMEAFLLLAPSVYILVMSLNWAPVLLVLYAIGIVSPTSLTQWLGSIWIFSAYLSGATALAVLVLQTLIYFVANGDSLVKRVRLWFAIGIYGSTICFALGSVVYAGSVVLYMTIALPAILWALHLAWLVGKFPFERSLKHSRLTQDPKV